jgi:hypothetical protein
MNMHIRAPGVLLMGAVALASSLALPVGAQAASPDDTVFSRVVVNGGKTIVLGLTTKKTVTITWTATDAQAIAASWAYLWHGPNTDDADGVLPLGFPQGTCTVSSTDATTSNCSLSFTIDAARDMDDSDLAGIWNVFASAQDRTDEWTDVDAAAVARITRASRLTVNAAPEPVKKGRTITVTGKLTRANWDTNSYTAYRGRSVDLQFRKKGSDTYTTLKTITSGIGGALKTTTKAKQDGYYRFVFSGSSTTGSSKATGDYVDVR